VKAHEYLAAKESGDKTPQRASTLLNLIDQFTTMKRVPRELAEDVQDALNAERGGAGVWQVVSRGRGARFILHLPR